MQTQTNRLYRFDQFLLLADERLLTREGKIVPLAPKVLETLLILVENSGRILSKDELMQLLWPDTYVEEGNLTQNISQIRKALGRGEWIETIPKRGYRFAAPVQVETEPPSTNGAVTPRKNTGNGHTVSQVIPVVRQQPVLADEALPLKQPNRNARLMAAILVGLATLSFALFLLYRRTDKPASQFFQQFRPTKLTTSGQARQGAISHDGKYVAYVEGTDDAQSLLVRQVRTTSQIVVVPAANVNFLGVTFSLDDTFIYYVAQSDDQDSGVLYQVPLLSGVPKKILSNVDSPVTLSPDEQSVAFVRRSLAQGESSLWLAKLDGTEERKLLARQIPDVISLQGPAWSADGKWIACAAGNGTSGESALQILAVNPVDGSARAIGKQSWSFVGQLAWLSDGNGLLFTAWRSTSGVVGDPLWFLTYPQGEARQITNDLSLYLGSSLSADATAFVTQQLNRVSRLWVLPANGAKVDANRATQIQSGFGDNYSDQLGLDWASDGRLVYSSHASGNLDLWISTTGGQQKQLTRDRHIDLTPAVSPDGRFIVFVSDRGGTRAIWRMDIDGNNPKQLTRGKGDASPSFTPDGKWVVYSSFKTDRSTLWKVPIEGGEPVALTDRRAFYPVVSPDGKWIACFSQSGRDFKPRLSVFPLVGGAPTVLEPVAFPDHALIRWTSDSRALCYIVTRQGVSNLWRSPLGGGAATQLTNFTTEQIFRFAWSRDGKSLACERGQSISEIVLLSNRNPEP
jgi:Tol biopolymer transport system component/DNA-binding winged helix-turn-helix (wHTH) protein